MIRPVTCVCFLMACGSGLYLYQSKHRVQVLDREIESTVRATDALREQIRMLHAEWTLMNDPQRLQLLADQFLNLKTVTPGQFTSLAELNNRLPAIRIPEPPKAEPPAPAIAEAPDAAQPEEAQAAVVAVAPLPIPPLPVAVPPLPRVAEQPQPARIAEHRPAPIPAPAPVRPVMAEQPAPRPAPSVRPVVAAELPRPGAPRVMPVGLPAQPAPMGGSSLGMARGSAAPPPPQPLPVSASQWVTNGGGG